MSAQSKKNELLAPERFRGLSPQQIAALLTADEMAKTWRQGQTDIDQHSILLHLEKAGLPFGLANMLLYARHFENEDKPGLAEAWYKFAAIAGETAQLKAFYLRRGWVSAALDRFGSELTPAEIHAMGLIQLRFAAENPSKFSGHFEAALAAFQASGVGSDIERLIGLAVSQGNMKRAEVAAQAAGRTLRLDERRRAIEAMIERANGFGVFEELERYPFPDLATRCVRSLARSGASYAQLKKQAARLGVRLRVRDIEAMLAKSMESGYSYKEWIEIAGDLASISTTWDEKETEVFAKARDQALRFGEAKDAVAFAARSGKPLTIDELRDIVERYASDDRPAMRAQADFARERLVQLLHEEANPPPF